MNIDINNYEEYFLLYIDNELSAQERTAVEMFLKENEEFKREFELLKSTVLAPEVKINLSDKSFLFRKEPKWINENNYEEIFVLYHDGELSQSQIIETDRFLELHPELTGEFILLGKVKLEPEKGIIFGDKKSLYRKEKHGRVIPLIMWRSMAAAVFIGFGFWFFVNPANKPADQDKIVAQVNQSGTSEKTSVNQQPTSLKGTSVQNEDVANNEQSKNEGKVGSENDYVKPGKQTETVALSYNKKAAKVSNKISTDFIDEKTDQMSMAIISKDQIETVKSLPETKINNGLAFAKNNETLHESAVDENTVSTAAYISPEPTNQNYVFYNIPADKFKKSKVGAFLKKVKRVVDRNDPLKLIFSAEEKQVAKN